jgi:hypothetical protein
MIDAIVTSVDNEALLATPMGADSPELSTLVGKKVRYIDNSDRTWTGVVTGFEEPCVKIKFDKFPYSIGQGQILQILESENDKDE